MIAEDIKNIKSSKRDLVNFGLIVGGIFIAIGFYSWWHGGRFSAIWCAAGSLLVILAITIPTSLKKVYKIWMIFGIVLGFFVTNLLLISLFYLVLTPLSFFARVSGKRFLDLGFGGKRKTYWQKRSSGSGTAEIFERQF